MLASSRILPRLSAVQSTSKFIAWPVHWPRRSFSLRAATPPPPPTEVLTSTQQSDLDLHLNNDPMSSSTPPVKPTWAELSTPASLPDPTLLEPASAILLSLPSTLGISYALFIPLMTLFIRGSLTLPLTLWQRARTRKFAHVVIPLLRKEQTRISFETRTECRRQGKTFEEYQELYKKRAKAAAKQLARAHSASPMWTLIVPPLLHVPIFITTTLILRDLCAQALIALPLTPTTLASLLSAAETSSLSSTSHAVLRPELLGLLHDLASTPVLWCDSLILPDPSMLLPLGVGLAALLNVEVTARTRRANARAALLESEAGPGAGVGAGSRGQGQGQQEASSSNISTSLSSSSSPVLSAAEKRRLAARVATTSAAAASATTPRSITTTTSTTSSARRTYVTPSSPTSFAARTSAPRTRTRPSAPPPTTTTLSREERAAQVAADEQEKLDPRSARIMTNVLRFSAVLFMPIAAMAPSAVCVYWIASNLFTLGQSIIFGIIDRRRDKQRRMDAIIR